MQVNGKEVRALLSVLGILLIIAILIEPRVFSFERGGHFNWVPIHSLAITSHSNLSSGFVGFSCKLSDFSKAPKEAFIYEYFNRYPVFFAVASDHLLTLLGKTTQAYLLASKQLMNVVFVLTLGFIYLSLRELRLSRIASSSGTLAIAASPLWLNYRPMYHFDQPGLLGYSICIFIYCAWIRGPRLEGKSPHYLGFLLIATSGGMLGRSFITPMFLCATTLIAFLTGAPRKDKLYLLLTTALSSASIAAAAVYASTVESVMNRSADISTVANIAVFQSAQRRLGLPSANWPEEQKAELAWSSSIKELAESVANLLPTLPFLLAGLIGLYLMIRAIAHYKGRSSLPLLDQGSSLPEPSAAGREARSKTFPLDVWLATLVASLGWLVLFKNLIVFHDYTVIFLAPWLALTSGILIDLFLADFSGWAIQNRTRKAIRISIVAVLSYCFISGYVSSTTAWSVSPENKAKMASFYVAIDAFNQEGHQLVARRTSWLPDSPYAQCLMLNSALTEHPGDSGRTISDPPIFPLDDEKLDHTKNRSQRSLRRGSLKPVLFP